MLSIVALVWRQVYGVSVKSLLGSYVSNFSAAVILCRSFIFLSIACFIRVITTDTSVTAHPKAGADILQRRYGIFSHKINCHVTRFEQFISN